MRNLLIVSAASVAFATGAYAQSLYGDPATGAIIQAPTAISFLCGVNYAMQDPDANIRLELLRDCSSAGLEGGAGSD
jgi:hypothetical protein